MNPYLGFVVSFLTDLLTDFAVDFVAFPVFLAACFVVCVVFFAVDFAALLDFPTAFCVDDAAAASPVRTRDECFVRWRTVFAPAASAGTASATAAINAARNNVNDFALIGGS
jgi:hypothetical protein